MYTVIWDDNTEEGPIAIGVLALWAEQGRVKPRTGIRDLENGRQFLACDLAELAAVFDAQTAKPGDGLAPSDTRPPVLHEQADNALVLRPRRSRIVAGLLGFFFGAFGVHRYYLGYTGLGTLYLCITLFTCIGAIVTVPIGMVEGIRCIAGDLRDADGQSLR